MQQLQGRAGILIEPYLRLNEDQVKSIHEAGMDLLQDPGLLVWHEEAIELFAQGGARLKRPASEKKAWQVQIPEKMVWDALSRAPSTVKLGARNPNNTLILDAKVPRVYFGSGSESNFWLEAKIDTYVRKEDGGGEKQFATFKKKRGSVAYLCRAARLAEQLEHLDFFIRPVNIQDADITEENKDVNKFFACLNNITKHVMAGLTDLGQLNNVLRLAEIIAGGEAALRENPLISFIACVPKSPLELGEDATAKMLAIVRTGLPLVISSSPQGGSTAPVEEAGMVVQINAEILGAVVLSQLAQPGAPVIYGSVPVRARMDNLHDMYGAPEFNQYNVDCVQMARFYGLPCYSTAGVADAKVPGIQASVEKMFSHLFVTTSGPHLVHYAFGLLEETQTFSPEQAVLDNHQIGMVKFALREPAVKPDDIKKSLAVIREVMESSLRLYARYTRRKLHQGEIYIKYPFEGGEDREETLINAHAAVQELLDRPAAYLPRAIRDRIVQEVPGVLSRLSREGD